MHSNRDDLNISFVAWFLCMSFDVVFNSVLQDFEFGLLLK
jgi:hypothetical protein